MQRGDVGKQLGIVEFAKRQLHDAVVARDAGGLPDVVQRHRREPAGTDDDAGKRPEAGQKIAPHVRLGDAEPEVRQGSAAAGGLREKLT